MGRSAFSHTPDQFQQEAIACRDRGIRIVAPAGSGKTETLARRVAARIGEGVPPSRILVLSFDQSGIDAFRNSLRGVDPKSRLPCSLTFNDFGLALLRRHFNDRRRVLDAPWNHPDLAPLLATDRLRPLLRWDGVERTVFGTFMALKNQGFALDIPEQRPELKTWLEYVFLRLPETGYGSLRNQDSAGGLARQSAPRNHPYGALVHKCIDAYYEYNQRMEKLGVLDVVDQRLQAFWRLRRNPTATALIKASFDEIILDEFQDVSRIEALLVWLITGENTTLVLSGDDDQAIFDHKQARAEYLIDPARFFRRPFMEFGLASNYRCAVSIARAANKVIRHNKKRVLKVSAPHTRNVGDISVEPFLSREEEYAALSNRISSITHTHGAARKAGAPSYSDIAVVCRTRRSLDAIKRHLDRCNIPSRDVHSTRDRMHPNSVNLVICHEVKGKQWPVVMIPHAHDGTYPNMQRVLDGEIEAERRLFYVAMTRSVDTLYFSYVRDGNEDRLHRSPSGRIEGTTGASRFLFEAGLIVERGEKRAEAPPQPDERVSRHDERSSSGQLISPSGPRLSVVRSTRSKPCEIERTEADIVRPTPQKSLDPGVRRQEITIGKAANKALLDRYGAPHRFSLSRIGVTFTDYERMHSAMEMHDPKGALDIGWKIIKRVLDAMSESLYEDKGPKLLREQIGLAIALGVVDTALAEHIDEWKNLDKFARNDIAFLNGTEAAIVRKMLSTGIPNLVDAIRAGIQGICPNSKAAGVWGRVAEQGDLSVDDCDYLRSLADAIQQGRPHVSIGAIPKVLEYDPEGNSTMVLGSQLLFLIRDIEYWIEPDRFCFASPVFYKFVCEVSEARPVYIRQPLETRWPAPTDEGNASIRLLTRILISEANCVSPTSFLERVITTSGRNGQYRSGLRLVAHAEGHTEDMHDRNLAFPAHLS